MVDRLGSTQYSFSTTTENFAGTADQGTEDDVVVLVEVEFVVRGAELADGTAVGDGRAVVTETGDLTVECDEVHDTAATSTTANAAERRTRSNLDMPTT